MVGFIGLSVLVPFALAALTDRVRWLPHAAWLPDLALYAASGLAAWLVWRRIEVGLDRKRAALRRWGWQLLLSGLWPAALFGLHSPAAALALLILLAAASAATLFAFRRLQRTSALLLLPYLAWLLFTAALSADRF